MKSTLQTGVAEKEDVALLKRTKGEQSSTQANATFLSKENI